MLEIDVEIKLLSDEGAREISRVAFIIG